MGREPDTEPHQALRWWWSLGEETHLISRLLLPCCCAVNPGEGQGKTFRESTSFLRLPGIAPPWTVLLLLPHSGHLCHTGYDPLCSFSRAARDQFFQGPAGSHTHASENDNRRRQEKEPIFLESSPWSIWARCTNGLPLHPPEG